MTGFNSKREAAADKLQEPMKCLDCGSHNVGIPATYDSLVNSVKAQPAQEPVAWVWKDMRGQDIVSLFEPRFNSVPLYTAPPQREWVGLTDDEVNNLAAGCHLGKSVQGAIYEAAAKLKEKNA